MDRTITEDPERTRQQQEEVKKKIVKKIRPDKCVDHFVTLQGEQN